MGRKLSKQFYQHIIILIIVLFSISHAQVDTVWTKTFGGEGYDTGSSVQKTSAGGYIIVGTTNSFGAGRFDVWLIKTDASGDTLWTKTFGGNDDEEGYSVQQTIDDGYIVTGAANSFGFDVWLIKTDTSGDTLWTKTFGDHYSSEFAQAVEQSTDEGFIIIANKIVDEIEGCDIWLVKTNVNGDTLWTKTFRGLYGGNEYGYSIQQTYDEGYIIAGATNSFSCCQHDIWVIKTNVNGDTLWTRTYGESGGDFGFSVQQTIDGGYITAANTYSLVDYIYHIQIIKINHNGDTLWTKTLGRSDRDFGECIRQTSDNGYIVVGRTYSYGNGGSDIWLIRLDSDPTSVKKDNSYLKNFTVYQNYPNPFNPSTTIEFDLPTSSFVSLKVYNVMGQEVSTLVIEELLQGNHKVEWNPENLSSGVYFYKLETKGYSETKKLVLMK